MRAGRRFTLSPAGWAIVLFLLALIPRLPGLRRFLTTDEPFFVQEAATVMAALLRGDFQETYWHYYPGVTLSWLSGFGLRARWAVTSLTGGIAQPLDVYVHGDILDLIVAVRLPYVLLAAIGVVGFYLLARRLLGHGAALLGALFIAFDPFFIAHSRVAHGDAPVTVFMGLSALAFFVYLQTMSVHNAGDVIAGGEMQEAEGSRRWLLLSAVMGGLAALTKAPGPFMAPFVVLIGAGDWLINTWRLGRPDWQRARRWLADLALWGGVAVLVFVALWPAMWVDPAGTLTRMISETFGKVEEGHLVFFMGQPALNPGPGFYPYVVPFRLTPVTLIAAVASVVVILGGSFNPVQRGDEQSPWSNHLKAAALLWLFAFSLLLLGDLSPKKQDRYLLPLFPFLDLLGAFACIRIAESASRRIGVWATRQYQTQITYHVLRITYYVLRLGLPLLLLIVHALPVATIYPYYLAYFNPLMGGLPRAVETTLVGWGEGMEQVAAYLNQRPDADRAYVAAVPAQTLLPYFRGTGENFYTNDVALRADYVILYVSQVQRLAPSPEIVHYFLGMRPEHTVDVLGVPYAWIYPGPKLISADVPSQATLTNVGLGDQLRLAGYLIAHQEVVDSAENSGSSSPVPGGQTVSHLEVTLFWHALARMADDYTISVRLVAPDGRWLAQHDSWPAGGLLPTSQWRQADYVEDIHTLQVPPDATVDRVQVVVYDAANGQPLGAPIELPVVYEHDQ
jgi:4-amino-4-deoxy-L-arabinose transferase-like glycosyltransferase